MMTTRRLTLVAALLCSLAGCSRTDHRDGGATVPAAPANQEQVKTSATVPVRWVPADAAAFIHVRCAGITGSAAFAEVRQLLAKSGSQAWQIFENKYAPAPANIEAATLIFLAAESMDDLFSGPKERVSPILVITTFKPYDKSQLEKAFGAGVFPQKYKDQTYYLVGDQQFAFRTMDERTFAVGSNNAVRTWLDRSAAKNGPLTPVLSMDSQTHAVVIGINPSALPASSFAPFVQPPKAADGVFNTIRSGPASSPAALPNELWTTVAQPLRQAACITVTFDLDKGWHGAATLDFTNAEQAENGVKALQAGRQAARLGLGTAIADLERGLREGIDSYTFDKSSKPAPGPKALVREVNQAAADLFGLAALATFRDMDDALRDLAIERRERKVHVKASMPIHGTAWFFGISAVASLNVQIGKSFSTVDDNLGLPVDPAPKVREVPKLELPPGMRAVGVRIEPNPFALPGSRVDVICTSTKGKDKTAKVLLKNVLVLAVDSFRQGEANAANTATLALLPEHTLRLAVAREAGGTISLVLRPLDDGGAEK